MGSDGGAPCEELAVTQIVVDPGTRWGRGWCTVVLSDKGPPRWRCSASLSPGRPTAQGTPGGPKVSAALHTPGPRGWWGRRWHRPDKATDTLAQHLVEKPLLWGRRRAQGSGWREAGAPTPYLCSPRPRVSGWVGAGCTGGLLEGEVEGSKLIISEPGRTGQRTLQAPVQAPPKKPHDQSPWSQWSGEGRQPLATSLQSLHPQPSPSTWSVPLPCWPGLPANPE